MIDRYLFLAMTTSVQVVGLIFILLGLQNIWGELAVSC